MLCQETLWVDGWMLKRDGAWPSACSPRRMAGRPGCTLGTHRPGPGRPRATVKALPPAAWPPEQADNAQRRRGAGGRVLSRDVVRAVRGPGQKNGEFTGMDDGSREPTA